MNKVKRTIPYACKLQFMYFLTSFFNLSMKFYVKGISYKKADCRFK